MFHQSKTINTSLKQIPAQVKKIDWSEHEDKKVLDYGAGKYHQLVQDYVKERTYGIVDSYEPYSDDESVSYFPQHKWYYYDVVLCSNVLNVIKQDRDMELTLIYLAKFARESGVVYIQVYEGNRSGESKETPRGWQRNAQSASYLEALEKVWYDISFKNGTFTCRNPKY